MLKRREDTSLRTQLISLVCLVTLIPFVIGQWLSYRQTADVIEQNLTEQTQLNLQQMEKTLDATLASYEDLLYQMYTDDTMVDLVNKLVAGKDMAVSRNQLQRSIRERRMPSRICRQSLSCLRMAPTRHMTNCWPRRRRAHGWIHGMQRNCISRWPAPTARTIFLRPMPSRSWISQDICSTLRIA